MLLDRQTEREIATFEAMQKDSETLYNSKFGKVQIDREEGTMRIGVTDGGYIAEIDYDTSLPVWLNIMIAEDAIVREREAQEAEEWAELAEYGEEFCESDEV